MRNLAWRLGMVEGEARGNKGLTATVRLLL
jgi:hypothetical protein